MIRISRCGWQRLTIAQFTAIASSGSMSSSTATIILQRVRFPSRAYMASQGSMSLTFFILMTPYWRLSNGSYYLNNTITIPFNTILDGLVLFDCVLLFEITSLRKLHACKLLMAKSEQHQYEPEYQPSTVSGNRSGERLCRTVHR